MKIENLLRSKMESQQENGIFDIFKLTFSETFVCVNFQIPVINFRKDQESFADLVSELIFKRNTKATFTSGYFNPITETYNKMRSNSQGN